MTKMADAVGRPRSALRPARVHSKKTKSHLSVARIANTASRIKSVRDVFCECCAMPARPHHSHCDLVEAREKREELSLYAALPQSTPETDDVKEKETGHQLPLHSKRFSTLRSKSPMGVGAHGVSRSNYHAPRRCRNRLQKRTI